MWFHFQALSDWPREVPVVGTKLCEHWSRCVTCESPFEVETAKVQGLLQLILMFASDPRSLYTDLKKVTFFEKVTFPQNSLKTQKHHLNSYACWWLTAANEDNGSSSGTNKGLGCFIFAALQNNVVRVTVPLTDR